MEHYKASLTHPVSNDKVQEIGIRLSDHEVNRLYCV